MKTKRKYRSEASAAIYETAQGMLDSGIISKKTMRKFDTTCLQPVEQITPQQIHDIREKARVSQPIFATYLNVSKNLVSDWERGVKKPGGPALRLLNIVKKRGLEAIA